MLSQHAFRFHGKPPHQADASIAVYGFGENAVRAACGERIVEKGPAGLLRIPLSPILPVEEPSHFIDLCGILTKQEITDYFSRLFLHGGDCSVFGYAEIRQKTPGLFRMKGRFRETHGFLVA